MGFITDLIFSVPLGIIYTLFIQKLSDVLFTSLPYNDKYQKSLILLFIGGIVGIILAQTVFTYNATYKNNIIKQGLIIGGIILILYSTLTHWDKMINETKLLIIGISLAMLFWYCYRTNNEVKLKKITK